MFPIPEVLNSPNLAGILGCEVGSLPKSIWDSSLELRTKVQTFERGYLINVLEIAKRIAQYLSIGERVILVNIVLDSLPTYIMFLVPIPVKAKRVRIDQRRNLIWEDSRET